MGRGIQFLGEKGVSLNVELKWYLGIPGSKKGVSWLLHQGRTLGSVWTLLETRLPVVLVTCESGTYL